MVKSEKESARQTSGGKASDRDGRWGHSKRSSWIREGEIHLARGKIGLFLSLWEKVKYLMTDSTKLRVYF